MRDPVHRSRARTARGPQVSPWVAGSSALEQRRADGTALAGLLDHKQPPVHLAGFVDQFGEMLQTAFDVEIVGPVDDRLDPQRATVLQILLDTGVLVAEVDPDLCTGGEDPRLVAMLGRASELAGEHHRDFFGAADPDVVLHQRFEERTGAARIVEHERAGRLDLAHRQLPPVPGLTILGSERRGDLGDPAIEERLHVLGPEGVADSLQPAGLIAGREPVRQRGKRDPGFGGLAFGPFVPVDPDPREPRTVGADLDERGPEVLIQDVEVVRADPSLLPEEIQARDSRRVRNWTAFERPLAALRFVLGSSRSAATHRILRPRAASTSDHSRCRRISASRH